MSNCPYCGMIHAARCPSVKAFEYHEDGTIKRVEFMTPRDYPQLASGGAGPLPSHNQTTWLNNPALTGGNAGRIHG